MTAKDASAGKRKINRVANVPSAAPGIRVSFLRSVERQSGIGQIADSCLAIRPGRRRGKIKIIVYVEVLAVLGAFALTVPCLVQPDARALQWLPLVIHHRYGALARVAKDHLKRLARLAWGNSLPAHRILRVRGENPIFIGLTDTE